MWLLEGIILMNNMYEEERHGESKSYMLFYGCLLAVTTGSVRRVPLDVSVNGIGTRQMH